MTKCPNMHKKPKLLQNLPKMTSKCPQIYPNCSTMPQKAAQYFIMTIFVLCLTILFNFGSVLCILGHFWAIGAFQGILKGIVGRFILAAAQHSKMKKINVCILKTKMSKCRLNFNGKENQKIRIKTIVRSKFKKSSFLVNSVGGLVGLYLGGLVTCLSQ